MNLSLKVTSSSSTTNSTSDYTNSVSGSAESFENRSARAELMERVVVLKRTVGMYETESTEMQSQYTVGPKGAVLDTSARTSPIGGNVFSWTWR